MATPTPAQHDADDSAAAKSASQRRRRKLLGAIFIVLAVILVIGIVGIAITNHATTGPSSRSGSEGSSYVNPPFAATIWMVVTLTDAVALIALGIVAAVSFMRR